jgi:DNA-directed RNA polymerase specialized sigma subunit
VISRNSNIENQLKKHERLLQYFLRKRFGPVVPEDVESAARIGLYFGISKYDESKGMLTPYLKEYITGFALREFQRQRFFKFPEADRGKHKVVVEAIRILEQRFQRSPTQEEISEHTGITDLEVIQDPVSLDSPAGEDGAMINTIAYPENSPRLKESVSEAMNKLKPNEKAIICLYFWGGFSLTEIAQKMNVTPQRIQRIKEDALKKLKKEIRL